MQKATDVTTDRLTATYLFPASDRPVIRGNMVASVDGAATADGKSAGLGSDGDRQIFHLQRALADVIVVGAHTAVVEGYRPPTVDQQYIADRVERGQNAVPPLILVSQSLNIPDDYATIADPGVIIATCAEAPDAARKRLQAAGATLVDCGETSVDSLLLADELHRRGLRRVLCEGGPRFLATIAAAGLLDELALTVSPTLVGGDAQRIAHGAAVHVDRGRMRLRHLISDDEGYLYQLWERADPRSTTQNG